MIAKDQDTLLLRIKLWGGVIVAVFLAGVGVMVFAGQYARASDLSAIAKRSADLDVRTSKQEQRQQDILDLIEIIRADQQEMKTEMHSRFDRVEDRLNSPFRKWK